MSWPRSNSSNRRSSLTSLRDEPRSGGSSSHNRSDSAIDVRTPVQQRLKRLQTQLREEQVKQGLINAKETDTKTSVSQRLKPQSPNKAQEQSSRSRPRSPVTPMAMSPPKRQHLKRRSDQNHNDMDMQGAVKRTRFDKSPSPSVNRRFATARHSAPCAQTIPPPPQYENDIEMTDASIQEEVRKQNKF